MDCTAVTRSRSMISSAVPASKLSMVMTAAPAESGPPSVMVRPADQKYGNLLSSLSSGVRPSALPQRQLWMTGVPFACSTPLGLALVPEV